MAKVSNQIDEARQIFNDFDVDQAYVKAKHLSTAGGDYAKFNYGSKIDAEMVLKNTIKRGDIVTTTYEGVTKMGNVSYRYILNAHQVIGTKGETFIRIILAKDGGMLSAFPVFIEEE